MYDRPLIHLFKRLAPTVPKALINRATLSGECGQGAVWGSTSSSARAESQLEMWAVIKFLNLDSYKVISVISE